MPTTTLYFDDATIWVATYRGYEVKSWVEAPIDADNEELGRIVRESWEGYEHTEVHYDDIDWDAVDRSGQPWKGIARASGEPLELAPDVDDIELGAGVRTAVNATSPAWLQTAVRSEAWSRSNSVISRRYGRRRGSAHL